MSDRESIAMDVENDRRQDDRQRREEYEREWCVECNGNRFWQKGKPPICRCYCECGEKLVAEKCPVLGCTEFGS